MSNLIKNIMYEKQRLNDKIQAAVKDLIKQYLDELEAHWATGIRGLIISNSSADARNNEPINLEVINSFKRAMLTEAKKRYEIKLEREVKL